MTRLWHRDQDLEMAAAMEMAMEVATAAEVVTAMEVEMGLATATEMAEMEMGMGTVAGGTRRPLALHQAPISSAIQVSKANSSHSGLLQN